MMDKIGDGFLAIVSGIITLAIIAVIVSTRSQAPTVIGTTASGLAEGISAAVSPVTGTGSVTAPATASSSSSILGGAGGLLGGSGSILGTAGPLGSGLLSGG